MDKLTRREQYGLVGFVVILTGVVLGSGGSNRFGSAPLKPTLKLTSEGSVTPLTAEKALPAPAKELQVYVTGAVKKPGLYHFKEGQRFHDAIQTAGGFRPDALQDVVNLAEPLKDADHLRIPTKSVKSSLAEPTQHVASASTKSPKRSSKSRRQAGTLLPPAQVMVIARPLEGREIGGEDPVEIVSRKEYPELTAAANRLRWGGSIEEPKSGRADSDDYSSVDINTENEDELQRLPGVGPATAKRIIKHRKEKGDFESPEDLMDVKGIGPKSLSKMKPRIKL